ncbi:expressed unknown protein [Seminavis robusta]|uniref:YqgF/RNase H-like domain-containing protein n=1 Tax=Seminavis robusta TaxID=568900 RepID=A0A9N8HB70_9STRA|nr:expressed unknown protein [Seminavis robusta]|eukprot:Sro267_g103360.1 n/a (223) ;mRNA; r:22519-23187
MSKTNLLNFLAKPSTLASKLDWKKASGTVLAMDVGSDRIGLAIASHPNYGDSPLALDPMPIKLETRTGNRKALAESTIQELKKIVKNYNVCGFVVSWPLQKEGRCGAPCGKVLHTLDSLVEESSDIVNSKRPFCLWDDHHYHPSEDEWGRTPQYGETTNKTVHRASVEQYAHKCSSSVAVDVWKDYCKKHWPVLYEQEEDIWQVNGLSDSTEEESNVAAMTC